MSEPQPTPPRPIPPPMWSAVLDVKKGVLTITRDDEHGTMPYEEAKHWLERKEK